MLFSKTEPETMRAAPDPPGGNGRGPFAADIGKAILFSLIPLIVFAVAMLVYEDRRSRRELEQTVFDASSRLTQALDSELRQQLSTLSTLAVSTDLDDPLDLPGFYEEALRVQDQHAGWFAINLVEGGTARPIMNTLRPFGEALPPVGEPEDYAEVARTQRPLIAGRLGRPGAVIRRPFITIRVPVLRDEAVRFVLSAALTVESVQALMMAQLERELPRLTRPAVGAAVLDAEGRFVARLVEPGAFAGRLASDETRANMRNGPGVYEGKTVEGVATYGAYTQSALTGWTVVLGISRADADALVNRTFWAVLAGGVASMMLAGLLALQFGRDAARRRAEAERLLRFEAEARLLEQARASVAEKETLLREVHHRLKNNMQTIISLLRTTARNWPEAYQEEIRVSVRRMIAMVNVHQRLYRARDLSGLDLGPYLATVVEEVAVAEGAQRRGIECRVRYDEVRIDLNRALPLGLIMTECLINAFKHGFPNGRTGTITVSLERTGGTAVLRVTDDGVGVPAAVSTTRSSLGIDLIETLARQIGGTTATRAVSPGTEVTVEFPVGGQQAP